MLAVTDLGHLEVWGTDLAHWLRVTHLEPGNAIAGAVALSPRVLEVLLAACASWDEVTLELAEGLQDRVMVLAGGQLRGTLPAAPAAEWPALVRPKNPTRAPMEVSGTGLRTALGRVLGARSQDDESRPILQGVYLEVAGRKVSVMATDGRRACRAVAAKGCEDESGAGEVILAGRTAELWVRPLWSDEETLMLHLLPGMVLLEGEGRTVHTRCALWAKPVEETFPNVAAAFPGAEEESTVHLPPEGRRDLRVR
jgi:DNA polymerase III sliding clamp (beta) subunit (PCNA family)